MANAVQSIQSNPIPQGGVAALQPVTPNVTPASISQLVNQLMPTIAAFRAASSQLTVPLDTMSVAGLGESSDIRLKSVGLGFRVRSYHTVVINIANAGAGVEEVFLSPHFPYNLIRSTAIEINGGETTYSASGRAGLMVYGRQRPGFFQPQPGAAGLNSAWCNMSLSANGTFTAAAASAYTFGGQALISVALGTNTNLTINFITIEKLAHSRDTLIGALPLQNNLTFATLTMTPVSSLLTASATNQQSPLYNAGGSVTATLTSWTVKRYYDFWSIPTDSKLYQPLIQNAYQVIETRGFSVGSVGSQAFNFPLPSNMYDEALHLFINDSTGANLNTVTALPKMYITFNAGSVTPVTADANVQRALVYSDYGDDRLSVPGYWLYDGDDNAETLARSDDAGWLDTYSAAEPAWVFDVLDSLPNTPLSASIVREALVAGSTTQVGG